MFACLMTVIFAAAAIGAPKNRDAICLHVADVTSFASRNRHEAKWGSATHRMNRERVGNDCGL